VRIDAIRRLRQVAEADELSPTTLTALTLALSLLEDAMMDPSEASIGIVEYVGAAGLWNAHEANVQGTVRVRPDLPGSL
jgi:hypothetical protein